MGEASDSRAAIRAYARAARALQSTMFEVIRNEPGNIWRFTAYRAYIRRYNALVTALHGKLETPLPVDVFNESKIPGPNDTMANTQRELFEEVLANLTIIAALLEEEGGVRDAQVLGMRDFLAANLRRAMQRTPTAEIEVQDVVEHLLIGRGFAKGQDYDRETGRVKASGKESVPDFVLPKQGTALEVKLAKDKEKLRALVDEINADIRAYSKVYRSVIFVVYDLGAVRDEAEFRHDFESAEGVQVIVVKH